MDTKALMKARERIEEWTWTDLAWLPEDCPDGYPEKPKEYQISEKMQDALQTLKEEVYIFIVKHWDVLMHIRDYADRTECIYSNLEVRINEVAGEFGATDTASREALMYRLDNLFNYS